LKRRILIADDDPVIVSLVSLRLGMDKYEVLSAANGHQALQMIRAAEPLMAILDVQMPGKDGLAVLADLKADPMTRDLPVLMLTGDRDSDTVMAAVGGGASDFMVKPFDPDTLLKRVSRLCKSSAQVWTRSADAVWEL
jgi:twitching motility two-component system response regulator PilH